MSRRLSSLVIVVAGMLMAAGLAGAQEQHPHWSYKGATGPGHWAQLEKDYGPCARGHSQSPIDIHSKAAKTADLPAIAFDYKPSPLKIIDNGHSIQIDYAPGSSITVGDKQYGLVQFHFHRPSEEKIDGKRYDMVAHLVHRDAGGTFAVVAVLFSKGAPNALITTLWENLPAEKEVEKVVDGVTVNAADLLPKSHAYYTFIGSLTTPPCTEGVRWFVLKQPTTVSGDEVARFAKTYPMNARPVQPLHGRSVEASK